MEPYKLQDFRRRNGPLVSLCCRAAQFHKVPQKNIKNGPVRCNLPIILRICYFVKLKYKSKVQGPKRSESAILSSSSTMPRSKSPQDTLFEFVYIFSRLAQAHVWSKKRVSISTSPVL